MKKSKARFFAGALFMVLAAGVGMAAGETDAYAAKVKVKKVTVTSPTGKTVKVEKGKKVTLTVKVKVTPNKKANKKVTYKSKDKKIATVTSKGVVKGIKEGKTKIVVTSKKNKKKKATIRVEVVKAAKGEPAKKPSQPNKGNADNSGKQEEKISLVQMDVPNEHTINFRLNKAYALTPADIALKAKITKGGSYLTTLDIESLTTSDNISYTITMNWRKLYIPLNHYILVSIPSLSGVKEMEAKFESMLAPSYGETTIEGFVGKKISRNIDFSTYNGYYSYEIENLPEGITAECDGFWVLLTGTLEKAGITKTRIRATNESGTVEERVIQFVVCSEKELVHVPVEKYCFAMPEDVGENIGEYVNYEEIKVRGGSGDYDLDVSGEDAEKLEASAYIYETRRYLAYYPKAPGDYSVTITATDNKDENISTSFDVVIHVVKGITVSGVVKDGAGEGMCAAGVTFINKDKKEKLSPYVNVYAKEDGTYEAQIAPGTYDIIVESDDQAIMVSSYSVMENAIEDRATYASLYKDAVKITEDMKDYNFTLPLYKVTFTMESGKIGRYDGWYQGDKLLASGPQVYMRKGHYSLTLVQNVSTTADWWTGDDYEHTVDFTVSDKNIEVPVKKGELINGAFPAAKDTTKEATLDASYWTDSSGSYAYKFTPEQDGDYYISSLTSFEDIVYLYDAQTGEKLPIQKEGVDEESSDYTAVYYSGLEQGKTYIVGTGGRHMNKFIIHKSQS